MKMHIGINACFLLQKIGIGFFKRGNWMSSVHCQLLFSEENIFAKSSAAVKQIKSKNKDL